MAPASSSTVTSKEDLVTRMRPKLKYPLSLIRVVGRKSALGIVNRPGAADKGPTTNSWKSGHSEHPQPGTPHSSACDQECGPRSLVVRVRTLGCQALRPSHHSLDRLLLPSKWIAAHSLQSLSTSP